MKFFVVEQIPVSLTANLAQNAVLAGMLRQRTGSQIASLSSAIRTKNLHTLPLIWAAIILHFAGSLIVAFSCRPKSTLPSCISTALNRTQAEWLLDSFTVLRKYEERDHGEFRTKRIVLEIYDEIASAKQTGRAYQTRLNPVPADPSCCHAAATAGIAVRVG